MKVVSFIDTVSLFHQYVIKENTGKAEDFARKLGVSRATLYNMLSELESYGIEIEYSRFRETYYYKYPENVNITLIIFQES